MWFGTSLYITELAVILLIYMVVFWFTDVRRQMITAVGAFQNFMTVVTNEMFLMVFTILFLFVTQMAGLVSRYHTGFFFLFFPVIDYIVRMLYRMFLIKVAGNGMNATNIMLVALSSQVGTILKNIRNDSANLLNISCITIIDRDMTGQIIEGIPVVGNKDNYLDTHRLNVYDEVFIHIPYDYEFKLKKLILGFEQMGVTVDLNIEIFDIDAGEKRIVNLGNYSVISFSSLTRSSLEMFIKRFIDILGSLVGIILVFICLIIFGPVIKATSKGPVFFAQTRVGINGRRFTIYKFRSMYQDAETKKAELMSSNEMQGYMFKMENDPRITPVGRFLRKTSIDELPQFWNVLKGDMSLVGTRPPTEDEYEQYKNYHMRRLSIRPGITGLWQVYGRGQIKDFEDVVRLDLKYIDQWSLLLDLKLIIMTIGIVISGKGAE